jgi:hypothetical protein
MIRFPVPFLLIVALLAEKSMNFGTASVWSCPLVIESSVTWPESEEGEYAMTH